MELKDHNLKKQDIYDRIVTAVNIAIGDDGMRSKEILENFKQLCKMSKEQYKIQVKYYGKEE
tara:strand:+ start:72 stop:257 length:186 start_codon:yes stop_codon:yes gene_type:complete